MKPSATQSITLIMASMSSVAPTWGADEPEVTFQRLPDKVRVTWTHSTPTTAQPNSLAIRKTRLESSVDLLNWVPQGTEVSTLAGAPTQTSLDLLNPGSARFFRVRHSDTSTFLATGGAQSFGYGAAMSERLAANSSISPANFAALYPPPPSISAVSFDVTQAEYFPEWSADPAVWNASLPPGTTDRRLTDFRLDPASQQRLQESGFVVSEPRGARSFTDLYYKIWTDDLPVYVSSDSILHAWHRTWITILEEIEELSLQPKLVALVSAWQNRVNASTVPAGLTQARTDAQGFLGVSAVLNNYAGEPLSSRPLKAVNASTTTTESLFGSLRDVDWTQFGPRSHYTNSESLKNYFRSMMWLSSIDLRIDERADDQSLRQLGVAVVLALTLRDAGLLDDWEAMDQILTPFVGRADSMTPPQLLEILDSEGLGSLSAFTSSVVLENLLARIQTGQAGVQDILAHPIVAPLAPEKLVLPRSFTVFSQRFTPESWAMGRFVFDNIWRKNLDPQGPPMVRVLRRLPSALDINFAVMGNDTPATLLAQRMANPSGVAHRDGHDFSRELVSVRQTMDSQSADGWGGTLYLHHLGAIRSLSEPLPATVPQAMQTEAWRWKTVQTQLAGWTELRHDNMLYAKQSYTPPVLCFYPAGYVEPRPSFYAAMKALVDFASTTLTLVPMTGTYPGRTYPNGATPIPVDRASVKSAWLTHLSGMSTSLQTLTTIAQSEVARIPFTTEQTAFLQGLVQAQSDYAPNLRTYSGWYPRMYRKSVFANAMDHHPSEIWDPLVADIHTDAPDPVLTGDPGAVLYNATGNVALMLVAIDVNGEVCLHGGPSFTYYEFTEPYGQARLTDSQWQTRVTNKAQPPHPEWTNPWLTPGPISP